MYKRCTTHRSLFYLQPTMLADLSCQRHGYRLQWYPAVQGRHIDGWHSRITTGIDAIKRRKVHINIQTHSMIGTTLAHFQPKRGDFGERLGRLWGWPVNPWRPHFALCPIEPIVGQGR